MSVAGEVRIIPLSGLPLIQAGDDLGHLLFEGARVVGGLRAGDVLVVAQKVVSKAEGRTVRLADIVPSDRAVELAGVDGDPRHVEVILRESREVVRSRPPLVIAETHHGFVCASAGVDASNAPSAGTVVLLPVDPDASAAQLRRQLVALGGVEVGVIVSDTFGRAFREGQAEVAIGISGVAALIDLRGELDVAGRELHATQIAVADHLASAAGLVMAKSALVPAAIVRGVDGSGAGSAAELMMARDRDLFR